jgi:hypothetical protein
VTGARPFTRAQCLENEAFLKELRRTGNAREAARRLGAHRAKFTRRRAKCPMFAAQWQAALVLAEVALRAGKDAGAGRIVHGAGGRVQLRQELPGGLDQAARQRFLAALSATANVRLAAKAAGFSHAAFYHHKRTDPGFAREWRLALAMGYEALELALIEGWSPEAHRDNHWRHNDPPAIPPMSVNQALQLLFLHQKEAKLFGTPEPLRRRRGECAEARSMRLRLMHEARLERQREAYRIAEAARRGRREPLVPPHEPRPPVLPDLAQVEGWSKATGRPAFDEGRALFGGWRLGGKRER